MTSSTTRLEIEPSPFEKEIRGRFEAWLDVIVREPALHARFANTLSLLEHIGSVKIARTQSGPAIDADTLQHLAEEARHADLLKRIVGRIAGGGLDTYRDDELLAGSAARGYFARLDASVRAFTRELPREHRHEAAYNLVTWLIERRAMWLYPAYQAVLERHRCGVSVRAIIGEETRHLADVIAALGRIGLSDPDRLERVVEAEAAHFARLADRLMTSTVHSEPR